MKASLRHAALSVALLLAGASVLTAQQTPGQPRSAQPGAGQQGQPGQASQFGRPGQGRQMQQLEPSIVTMLIIDNNKEIALGQLARQHSKNEQVRHFADMIIKDHTQTIQQLQERAASGSRGASGAQPGGESSATQRQSTGIGGGQREAATGQSDAQSRQDDARTATGGQQSETAQRGSVARPAIGNQPGSELLQLHQEVAEACLESARRDAQKLGEEFDTHFMGAQIVMHKEMLDKLKVFQQHVSPELKQQLAQSQESVQKHLNEAQQIHQQLSKQGGSQRTGASEGRSSGQSRQQEQ